MTYSSYLIVGIIVKEFKRMQIYLNDSFVSLLLSLLKFRAVFAISLLIGRGTMFMVF